MSKKRLTPEEIALREKWIDDRFKINEAVRRYKGLSSDAYKLWAELAFGWSWDGPSCYPNYEVIAQALGWPRNRVALRIKELTSNGLIECQRRSFGYRYVLVVDLPEKFWESSLNNRDLVKDLRARKSKRRKKRDASTGMDHDAPHDAYPYGHHDASTGVHQDRSDASTGMDHDVHTGVDPYKQMKKEADEHQEEADEWEEEPAPASPASSDLSGMTDDSRASRGNEGSTDADMAEAEDLLEEAEGPPVRKSRRKKQRAGSPALVSGSASPRVPFPDAPRASQSASGVQFDAEPPPPPVETPEDLVWLLKGEIQRKWSDEHALVGFAEELSGKLRGQLTNTILRKYTADVILKMVRVLVWDWEVARGVCFPFKKDLRYPTTESLVQYAGELAARINTGFDYMATRRGALNTYHDLFIRKIPFIQDDDPF